MVIDVHSHSLPPAIAGVGPDDLDWHGITVRADPQGGLRFRVADHSGRLPYKNIGQTPEERIGALDRLGIDRQLLSMSPALWQFRAEPAEALAGAREYNDALVAICRRWPERFGGLAWLPLQDVAASVGEIERAVGELGLSGFAVATHVNGENWDSAGLFPILRAAEAAGAVVLIHPAQVRVRDLIPRFHLRNMIGNPWEVTAAAGCLVFGGVLDRLPDLKIVLAHGGGYVAMAMGRMDHAFSVRPEAQEFITRAPSDYLRRFHYDTITHSADALAYLIEKVGAEQVVLGTDYPADMATGDPVAALGEVAGLSPAEREMILSGNAKRLLGA